MPNHNRSDTTGVALVLAIAWIAFVIAYPRSWQAAPVELQPLKAGERACILKLPSQGPLRLMLEATSVLTLSFQPPAPCPSPCASAPALEVAAPTVPMPASHETREGIRVRSVTCLSADRQSDCYAVVALKTADVPVVMSAGRVWVSLESQ